MMVVFVFTFSSVAAVDVEVRGRVGLDSGLHAGAKDAHRGGVEGLRGVHPVGTVLGGHAAVVHLRAKAKVPT